MVSKLQLVSAALVFHTHKHSSRFLCRRFEICCGLVVSMTNLIYYGDLLSADVLSLLSFLPGISVVGKAISKVSLADRNMDLDVPKYTPWEQ